MPSSGTEIQVAPVAPGAGRSFGVRGYLRPLSGALTVLGIGLAVALTAALFRGSFERAIPVTVIADRAGLVMNPDAKVKMRDIQVGRVSSIEQRGGKAVLHLEMDPGAVRMIPADVRVELASSTVFGAKFVQLIPPPRPLSAAIHAGQVIAGDHVSVEINTVFQQLTSVLSTIEPEHLNQTLSALASALSGRGARVGRLLDDANAGLARLRPSLGNLRHDVGVAPAVLNNYADATPDLLATVDNAAGLGRTLVAEQDALGRALLSVIGLADAGNEIIGVNRGPLTDALHLLAPVTTLTSQYHPALYCALAGAVNMAKVPPLRLPGAEVMASLEWGSDPYRYPADLPKVAATGGSQCVGLPQIPFETRPPYVVADVGTNPWKYGNRGVEFNTAALKEWLFGHPVDGPPRNSAQIGMPG